MTGTVWPSHVALAFDLKGTSTRSSTGSASMSARRATTGPGLPPFRMPSTPMMPTPVFTSIPSFLRCSAASAAVRVSW